MALTLTTLAQQPELEADMPRLHSASWPEFLMEDPTALRYWGSLFATFPAYQYALCDDDDTAVAAGHTIPLVWDGTVAGLPSGWDAALEQGFRDHEQGQQPTALCGLSIVIDPAVQGKGVSETLVQAMKTTAQQHDLREIILPLRPTLKSQHPHMPMEEYLELRRADGQPLDPWLRLHLRLGATIIAIAPRSMVITGTTAEWEQWTGTQFPDSGAYAVAGALVPIVIDRENDIGTYEEPNIWIRYSL